MRHDKENVEDKLIFISLKHNAKPLINQCNACSPIVFAQTENTNKSLANQCDACSPIIFSCNQKLNSNYIPYNHRFLLAKEMFEVSIDEDHIACLVPSNQAFSVLNRKAKNILNTFSTTKPMDDALQKWDQEEDLSALLSKFSKAGLIRPETNSDQQLIESPHKLTAWLHLTDKCNLRCTYCYLPHESINMTEAIGKAAIDATFRSAIIHNNKAVKLKYAGGEPLLRMDLIETLHKYALQQAQEKKIELEGVILSNGTLLSKDKIERIRQLNLRVMVSLDGIGAVHDIQRSFKEGTGSFQQTMNGIELLLEEGIYPDISVTVTEQNVSNLAELPNGF